MSDQESTPFLVHDDEQDYHQDSHYINVHSKPANAHFKRALRLLTAILTVLAVGAGVVMIIAIVRMKSGPFSYVDETTKHMTGLTIVAFVNALIVLPMIFVAMPIVIPLVANLVLGIVTLVLSVALFDQNWPGIWHCRHYTQDPNRGWRRTSPSSYCTRKLHDVQVMTGIAGGLSLATGILLLFLVLLRIIAITRTRFWQHKNMSWRNKGITMPASISNMRMSRFTGFTVQCSFSIVPVRPVEDRPDALQVSPAHESTSRPVAAYHDEPQDEAAASQRVTKGDSNTIYIEA